MKEIDLVGLENLYYNSTYLAAASQAFQDVLRPYFNAGSISAAGQETAILQRFAYSCTEDLSDPTTAGHNLVFPFQLAQNGAVVWHQYQCTFTIHYSDPVAGTVDFTSPVYTVHQLDISYGKVNVEPAVAFENYNLGSAASPAYPWLGRYVQPLNLMLRDSNDQPPANAIAGVNAGYDYRVDAWTQSTPSDNICLPRYSAEGDHRHFYSHPNPAQCPMGKDGTPSCASGTTLPWADDMGDSLVYLAPAKRAKSWRSTLLQSYNCGGVYEASDRGLLMFYADGVAAGRAAPGTGDLSQMLSAKGEAPVSALGAGPLLIQNGHFVYDQRASEEGMPLDNYEVGGATGAGFKTNADGSLTLHIVNVDGKDNAAGMHDWLLGLYFLSPYAPSDGALAYGNGGDATLWINPYNPAVQRVLNDPADPNHAYFEALFVNNGNPGIVSNCSGFAKPPIGCSARPVHDGLFVYGD